MSAGSWILDSVGADKARAAEEEAARRRLAGALGVESNPLATEEDLRFVAHALELGAFTLLDSDDTGALREASASAFQLARTLLPQAP